MNASCVVMMEMAMLIYMKKTKWRERILTEKGCFHPRWLFAFCFSVPWKVKKKALS